MPIEQSQAPSKSQQPESFSSAEGQPAVGSEAWWKMVQETQQDYVKATGGQSDLGRTTDTPQEEQLNRAFAALLTQSIRTRQASQPPVSPQENH